jgi:hypothetical protein
MFKKKKRTTKTNPMALNKNTGPFLYGSIHYSWGGIS